MSVKKTESLAFVHKFIKIYIYKYEDTIIGFFFRSLSIFCCFFSNTHFFAVEKWHNFLEASELIKQSARKRPKPRQFFWNSSTTRVFVGV